MRMVTKIYHTIERLNSLLLFQRSISVLHCPYPENQFSGTAVTKLSVAMFQSILMVRLVCYLLEMVLWVDDEGE